MKEFKMLKMNVNKKYLYFDTCVLNELAYIENNDYIFKKLKEKNYVVCISEVNIYEILRDTKDDANVNKVVTMLQSIEDINILPFINDIINNYINFQQNPTCIKSHVIFEVLSNSELEFKTKAIKKYLEELKFFYKEFNKVVKTICNCKHNSKCKSFSINNLTYTFALLFLSTDIYSFSFETKAFYNEKKAKEFISKNFDYLILNNNSPFRKMAKFAIAQNENLTNGTFNDCIHSIYFDIIDLIISDDKHFLDYAKNCLSLNSLLETLNIKVIWKED